MDGAGSPPESSDLLVCTDVDGTLIRGCRAAPAGTVVVDRYTDGRVAVTPDRTGPSLMELARTATWCVVTTRTAEQFSRLLLPTPAWALVANGLVLLRNGHPVPAWESTMRRLLSAASEPTDEVNRRLRPLHRAIGCRERNVERAFLVWSGPEATAPETVDEAAQLVAGHGWHVVVSGGKLYILPECLDKAAAVAHLASHLQTQRIVAAGDSPLDLTLLLEADAAIMPADAVLMTRPLSHDLVSRAGTRIQRTQRLGLEAVEDILNWILAQARDGRRFS